MGVHIIHPGGQIEAAAERLHAAATRLLAHWAAARPPDLVTETLAVTLCTIAAIAFLNVRGAPGARWLVIPALLVTAGVTPAWVRKREFPCLGLDMDHLRSAIPLVARVCLITLPPVFLVLWLLTVMRALIPLSPAVSRPQDWLAWLLYQFLYVAVAEEIFFRGYVQANTARLLSQAAWLSGPWPQRVAILVSATCFALAHLALQGQIISLLVFLPGLVLAWLFVRTRSLLAPILFHGLANVSYGVMAAVLA